VCPPSRSGFHLANTGEDPGERPILEDPEADDVNPNAIRFARERLAGLHEDLDHAIGQYLDRLA